MNPVMLLVLFAGLILIVVAFRGHQDNAIAAVMGKGYKNSTLK